MVKAINAVVGALTVLISTTSVHAVARGLAWATDNNFASVIGSKPLISWYHHWQDGPVSQMPAKDEYVPMFWGPSKWNLWNSRVAEMQKKQPKHLMAFNEPDVGGQANMDPYYAASLYMQEIYPWAKKGVTVGSPAIVFNVQWMKTFLSEVSKKGGHVDFICIHWYGSWNDLAGFKKWVQTAHSTFNKPIWVTELGITSASNPSQQQVKNFMMNAFTWMDTQSYVQRAAWFGCFESNNPPDDYATGKNGMLKAPHGQMNDLGYWYAYTSHPDKRSVASRHLQIAAAKRDDNHCDKICQLRNASIQLETESSQ